MKLETGNFNFHLPSLQLLKSFYFHNQHFFSFCLQFVNGTEAHLMHCQVSSDLTGGSMPPEWLHPISLLDVWITYMIIDNFTHPRPED